MAGLLGTSPRTTAVKYPATSIPATATLTSAGALQEIDLIDAKSPCSKLQGCAKIDRGAGDDLRLGAQENFARALGDLPGNRQASRREAVRGHDFRDKPEAKRFGAIHDAAGEEELACRRAADQVVQRRIDDVAEGGFRMSKAGRSPSPISQSTAVSMPPPSAGPLTAATSGNGKRNKRQVIAIARGPTARGNRDP